MANPTTTRVLDIVGLLARLGLSAVWFVSGIAKAIDPRETKVAVRAYDVLSEGLVGPVATVLPYLEIGLGLLLLLGLATRAAAIASALLLLVFIAGVAQAAIRGLTIDCGCFGGGGAIEPGQTEYGLEVFRDIGFLALAVYLTVRPWSPLSTDRFVVSRTTDEAAEEASEEV